MSWLLSILALLPFYLLGALPSGKLVARWHGVEIEQHGSGNVGATNVARVLGKRLGALTLLLDILKGAFAVWLARKLGGAEFGAYAGLAAVCGHCFSIPRVFKGGKGVATSLGVLLALSPYAAGIALVAFALVFVVSRYVSLASVCAAACAALSLLVTEQPEQLQFSVACLALLIAFRHKDNLKRVSEGSEPKFS